MEESFVQTVLEILNAQSTTNILLILAMILLSVTLQSIKSWLIAIEEQVRAIRNQQWGSEGELAIERRLKAEINK